MVNAISTKALSSKNIVPILSGIKFNLTKEKLILTASDNDITIQTFIPADNKDMEIEKEGSIIIQGKYILDIVRKLPDKYVNIEVEFKEAISIKEEKAAIRARKEAERRAREAEQAAAEQREREARAQAAREEAAKRAAASSRSSSSNKSSSGSSNSSNRGYSSSIKKISPGLSGSSSSGNSSSSSGTGASAASYAQNFLGNKYVYGGTSLTNGTDCSGFVQSVYSKYGVSLPRTSSSQAGSGSSVSLDEVKAGDLIFYSSGGSVNHVAMYIGDGKVVHASNKRDGIKISNMNYRTPCKARRVAN